MVDIINWPEMKFHIPTINIEAIIMFVFKLFICSLSIRIIFNSACLVLDVYYTGIFIEYNAANN